MMTDFINSIDLLGDGVVSDSIIDKTISTFSDNILTTAEKYAFYGCSLLESVDLPSVTTIGNYAFQICSSLISVNMPSATSISKYAFYGCSELTSVDLPSVTTIGDYAFGECSSLESINFPLVTSVVGYTFKNCSKLTSVDLPSIASVAAYMFENCRSLESVNVPSATSVGNYAFGGCTRLASIDLPLVTSIGSYAFNGCIALTNLNFPLVTSVGNYAFKNCSKLTSVDLPSATSISKYGFQNCYVLTTVILRSETICTLTNINAFEKCMHMLGTPNPTYNPGGLHDGYIYVPSALLESYQNDSVWGSSTLQFRALEDYTVDGTITGELDPDKVNPREPMELTEDWSTIMTACNDGTYSTKYKVGDWKPLDLGSEGVVNMQIVAKDTDTLADGTGTAAVTWIAKELLATKHRMNPNIAYNYVYPEVDAWTETSVNNKWKSNNTYVTDTAEATWSITAETAGTLNIEYNTSNNSSNYNTLSLVVNGETIVSDYANTSFATHTIEVSEGDIVTVSAIYDNLKKTGCYSLIIFESTGTITTVAEIEKTTTRKLDSYVESTGTIGGWEKSEMRSYLKETIKPLIASEVSGVIVEVKKSQVSYNTAGSRFTQETYDDVWIPSSDEVNSPASTGIIYKLVYSDDTSRIKRTSDNSARTWYLRSCGSVDGFNVVYTGGSIGTNSGTSDEYYIALGFCTGVSK